MVANPVILPVVQPRAALPGFTRPRTKTDNKTLDFLRSNSVRSFSHRCSDDLPALVIDELNEYSDCEKLSYEDQLREVEKFLYLTKEEFQQVQQLELPKGDRVFEADGRSGRIYILVDEKKYHLHIVDGVVSFSEKPARLGLEMPEKGFVRTVTEIIGSKHLLCPWTQTPRYFLFRHRPILRSWITRFDIYFDFMALELDRLLGFSTHRNSVQLHPFKPDLLIYSLGSAVGIDRLETREQFFLYSHDDDITTLRVSRDGNFVATGQRGSQKKGTPALVAIWDLEERNLKVNLPGLSENVVSIDFSRDSRFVAASGEDYMFFVWDLDSDGEVIYSRRLEAVCQVVSFSNLVEKKRFPSYLLCTASGGQVLQHQMEFDLKTMTYLLNTKKMQMPAAGLQRFYTSGEIYEDTLFLASTTGEVCVFCLKQNVFREAYPVAKGTVNSICSTGSKLMLSGGDGKIRLVDYTRTGFRQLHELDLHTPITSLSVSGALAAAQTSDGRLVRFSSTNLLQLGLDRVTHTGRVSSVSFSKKYKDYCLTASENGELLVWDLNNFTQIFRHLSKTPFFCCCFFEDEVYAGSNEFLRVLKFPGAEMNGEIFCHKDAVRSVDASRAYIVTGGDDGVVRVWNKSTQQLVTQHTGHRKPCRVLVSCVDETQIFSCSEDRQLITFDLKKNRQSGVNVSAKSQFTNLCQRPDGESEIVTCGLDGCLLFWDVDYSSPRHEIEIAQENTTPRLTACAVSPSGRYLVVSGANRIYLYDLESECHVSSYTAHSQEIDDIKFTRDGRQLVSVGRNACLAVWNLFE